jgi:hypothetical protein
VFPLFPSELTVRTEPSGTDFARQVICGSALGLAGRSRVILLCHGYANSVDVARKSYSKFVDNFISQFPMAKPIDTDVFEFYWPGDEPYPGVSQLSYPFQIKNAKGTAILLAEYLINLPAPATGEIELYLVAHSLGNRVAVELLRLLIGGRGKLTLRGILMMAAAVPVDKVSVGGVLHDAALLMTQQFVLHSESDWVLKAAFRFGETAAFEGFMPHAVGQFGDPAAQWTNTKDMPNYGHSDYWPNPATSDMVARFFGYVAANAIQRSYIPSYLPVPANKIAQNSISK